MILYLSEVAVVVMGICCGFIESKHAHLGVLLFALSTFKGFP